MRAEKICFVLSAVPTIVSFFVRHPPLSKPRIVQGVVKDLREQHGRGHALNQMLRGAWR